MANSLARVKRATSDREAATREWREAMRAARADGVSLRQIAAAAQITHVRVLQILRDAVPRDAAYHKAHRVVEKRRGTPSECAYCRCYGGDKVYEWANLTGTYDDPMDYARLCRRCHRRYDRGEIEVADGTGVSHVRVLQITRE